MRRHRNEDRPVPYWRRAHTDWRFVIPMALMLLAIVTYVLSEDLSWRPHLQTQSGASP